MTRPVPVGSRMDVDQDIRAIKARIRTETLHRYLAPYINAVLQLKHGFQPSGSKEVSAKQLLHAVQTKTEFLLKHTDQLIEKKAKHITKESAQDLDNALKGVETTANDVLKVGQVFAEDTSQIEVRRQLVAVAEDFIKALAELLLAADLVEVNNVKERVNTVYLRLENAQKAPTKETFIQTTKKLEVDIDDLIEVTRRRLEKSRDQDDRDNLQAALHLVKRSVPIMVTSSLASFTNKNSAEIEENKKFAFGNLQSGLEGIVAVLNGQTPNRRAGLSLGANLDQLIDGLETFRASVVIDPNQYRKHEHRKKLEELLERIVVMLADVADQPMTRPKRRQDIVQGANNLRQALQDLLTEYEKYRQGDSTEDLDMASVHLDHNLKDLRRHLRRAIVDQVSDTFSTLDTPLQFLIDSALNGRREETIDNAEIFKVHSENMATVAELVCKMSPDPEGVGMLKYSAFLLRDVTPQVINAAILVSLKPNRTADDPAVQNLHQFKDLWRERAHALKTAMDSLIAMDDMLAVTEQHIIDDMNNGFGAIERVDAEYLDRVVGTIRGRCIRVTDMVDSALEELPITTFTENLGKATTQLRKVMPAFEEDASALVARVANMEANDSDEKEKCVDELISACDLVHGAVVNIRHALLLNRNPEDVDSDNEYEEDGGTTAVGDQRSQVSDGDAENQQRIMRHLPEETKREIKKHLSVYKMVQQNLVYEVSKWDEESNDLISLAKKMLKIMNDMTDFTNGRGPFKTTMDVINAAKEISERGRELEKIADSIGKECVESQTKNDLYSYIQKSILFCHQLSLTSRVKAEIKMVENEAQVSGLDSVLSLIHNAKNLTSAVLSIVKLAFIASTKYRKRNKNEDVTYTKDEIKMEWRSAKPQAAAFTADPVQARNAQIVRRRSDRRSLAPIRQMAAARIN
ncbi:unnamed protein product [Bursaphelenchus xylophilus]|uniref:(pine wood nematode) hypothetical protein n=1 Tax=Bursaphelenchus xylophilus TaxID=6326 RepID=A0A1I7RP70_BURXY|nr:unnamed protein product [Bursaphelenchus xylophilus]CAG9124623.1 unnamed protein product [Bursaphelenchus xylophilus]